VLISFIYTAVIATASKQTSAQ